MVSAAPRRKKATLKPKRAYSPIGAPRAKGNRREDLVQSMFAERGRYALVLRGSGTRGNVQQQQKLRVAGDVIVTPDLNLEFYNGAPICKTVAYRPGIQIEVGGAGKRFAAEFADLRAAAIPGYALALAIFTGMKPKRWLLADADGGWTCCEDLDDLLATIDGRVR